MSNTQTAAEEYTAAIAAELAQWRAAINDPNGTEHAALRWEYIPTDGHTAPFTWADYIDAVALEVVRLRDDDGDVRRVEVLRTYGGPGCRVIYDDRESERYVFVQTFVMGEPTATTFAYCPELCEWLREVYA